MHDKEPRRIPFARLPTPLVPLPRLEANLGGDCSIWMKRDDLTGLELSGNKVRKLEYIVADTLDNGFDTLVTEGTPQSNHCRATAAVCARVGLDAHLLLRPKPPEGLPRGNHLLETLFGARTTTFERDAFERDAERIIRRVLADEEAAGRRPRFTPMGASEPLGCWGYIRAMAELRDQLAEENIESCDLIMPVSSGATHAGVMLGQSLFDLRDKVTVYAVPVSDDIAFHTDSVNELCTAANESYELGIELPADGLMFLDGYVGDGYGVPTETGIETLRLMASVEAILLDPVYTAKAFAALIDGVRSGQFGSERPVVFLHTGGIFSNFAWPDVLVEG